ncbi:hypothetical protein [Legionella cardiaca]|uniref:Dot/Icm T4SS effector n=1 Tax=Legionella cardiaca TaxID=1071983 RepID=A0ABY8ARL6_9GAMM|nr:hypothetical protein [Legionella cardiaca]WED43094.1 hypothetical protein PXX05_14525 [Legionella cardiaca]
MFKLLKSLKAEKRTEQVSETPPKLTPSRRSLSSPDFKEKDTPTQEMTKKTLQRGISFKLKSKNPQEETPRRKTNSFFAQEKKSNLNQDIDNFIDAVKKSCPSSCKDNGGYFSTLHGDYEKILRKVVDVGLFSENLDFLEQFNNYMCGKITGEALYPFLEGLNLDDNEHQKSLIDAQKKNDLNGDVAKENYKEIAAVIFGFIDYNLRIKRSTIKEVLQQNSIDYN